MTRLEDLSGRTFGRWAVIDRAANTPRGMTRWNCRCACGQEAIVHAPALKTGHSRSCGCLKVETTIERSTKHGHATDGISPTYHTWAGMVARCTNPRHSTFARYGGRGIKVCDRWLVFANFLADMGEKPDGTSIDRIDSKGNYTRDNCRWATSTQQARNKGNNRRITVNGETRCISEWAEHTGIHLSTVQERVDRGWSIERAVSTRSAKRHYRCRNRQ